MASGLTFLSAQQQLADSLNLDQTVAATQTRLKRWLNLIQQDISSRYNFDFLKNRQIIQTIADETAGTVAVTKGTTTVTGTGTAFSTTNDVGSYIQFQGNNDWYYISSVASSTSLTLEEAFQQTTLTAGTYTLRKVFYDLNANIQRLLDVRQYNTPIKLTRIDDQLLDLFQPSISTTAAPTAYSVCRQDPALAVTAAKQLQITFFPSPDTIYNLEIRYIAALSDLSNDTDITQIPVQWHNVWTLGAEWLGLKYLNNSRADAVRAQYEYGIERMITQENHLGDKHPILQTSDPSNASRFLPFPAAFEQPY